MQEEDGCLERSDGGGGDGRKGPNLGILHPMDAKLLERALHTTAALNIKFNPRSQRGPPQVCVSPEFSQQSPSMLPASLGLHTSKMTQNGPPPTPR